MPFRTINPATGELVKEFPEPSAADIDVALDAATRGFEQWRRVPIADRAALMQKAAAYLEEHATRLATLMALEMGKPIAEGEAEAKKCAWVCRYYAENAEAFLAPDPRGERRGRRRSSGTTRWARSSRSCRGTSPFWQVFRFAAPGLMAGNVGILKHSSNVPQCALAIGEEVFTAVGFPETAFQVLLMSSAQTAPVHRGRPHPGRHAHGEQRRGASGFAELGGRAMKKMVMELGGSDPFIVLDDADVQRAASVGGRGAVPQQRAVLHRRQALHRAGEGAREAFTEAFVEAMRARPMGDPMDRASAVGPQAREEPPRRAGRPGQAHRGGRGGGCSSAARFRSNPARGGTPRR